MNTRGTFGGDFGAAHHHYKPFVPFSSFQGLPLKAMNPIARNSSECSAVW